MQFPEKFNFASVLRNNLNSLERRLILALLLIASVVAVMQGLSQIKASELEAHSADLRQAESNAELARQLQRSVVDYRFTVRQYLSRDPWQDGRADGDEVTDAAMRIGVAFNSLRNNGMIVYDSRSRNEVFERVDQQVVAITGLDRSTAATTRSGHFAEHQGAMMAEQADRIFATASTQSDAARARLSTIIRNWRWLIWGSSALTVALVVTIMIDLLTNVLPALRRMHGAINRLASGEIDLEVEHFELRELQALSSSLETFRQNAQLVRSLAYTDFATGLPNRRAFFEKAAARLANGDRHAPARFAIVLADVDRFKHINDDFGHMVGDQLVKLIGDRFSGCLGEDVIVARVGGDEFALCLPLNEGLSAETVGPRLHAVLQPLFNLGNFEVAVQLSMGIVEAQAGLDGHDMNDLVNKADLALYAAKRGGRNRSMVFSDDLEEERELDRALERDLTGAIERKELRLLYQPIHPVSHGVQEVEALVRWEHPVLGQISPTRFIPSAERSGMIVMIGQWIIQQALEDLSRWPSLSISLNISALQLQQEGFIGFLVESCRANRIASSRVILEVTETISIERNARALLTLNLLRRAGFRIALDDFGTGFSSLCAMKSFRFDRLKLDRSLINDISHDPASQAVFNAAVAMALRLGAEVVAEGISELSLVEPVCEAGCTHVQGFHYSEPIEAEKVEIYYAARRADESRVA